MKKVRLFKKKESELVGLGVKFAADSGGCLCDHDACGAKCGQCSGGSFARTAWAQSGAVDKAILAVPEE